jgi:CDP-glucose 4,6-dehydratase
MPNHTLFNGFYRRRRVLVTGHTGFKGAWLTHWLTTLGAEVTGYALAPSTNPSLFRILRLEKEINHITGDVRDLRLLEKTLRETKPEMIFHLAAQALVQKSFQDPRETMETNIMGTVNLFDAARRARGLRCIINVTSDKCYQRQACSRPYAENDPLGGDDPYSASKAGAEIVTQAFRHSFFSRPGARVGVATVRAGNVIGGGDWSENRLVPDCVRALHGNRAILIRNPRATRPWQYVLEPLAGYLNLGVRLWKEPAAFSRGWNFGPTQTRGVPVQEIVRRIIRDWGSGAFTLAHRRGWPEPPFLALNSRNSRSVLGWKPAFSPAAGLAKTIEWYKVFYRQGREAARCQCLRDLQDYIRAASGK